MANVAFRDAPMKASFSGPSKTDNLPRRSSTTLLSWSRSKSDPFCVSEWMVALRLFGLRCLSTKPSLTKKEPTEKSALATQPNYPQSQLRTSPQGLQRQTRFPSGSSTGSDKTKQAYRHCSFSERQDGNYEPNWRFYRNGAFDIPFRRWVKQLC